LGFRRFVILGGVEKSVRLLRPIDSKKESNNTIEEDSLGDNFASLALAEMLLLASPLWMLVGYSHFVAD